MNIACPSCGVKGNLPESQIPEDEISINIVCPKCQSAFDVAVNSPSVSSHSPSESNAPQKPSEPKGLGGIESYSSPEGTKEDPFSYRKDGPIISDTTFSGLDEQNVEEETSPNELPDYSPPDFKDSILENQAPKLNEKPSPKLSETPLLDFSGSSDSVQSFGGGESDELYDEIKNNEIEEEKSKDGAGLTGYLIRDQNFKFFGLGKELFVISAVNLLLTILTLGIYRFWAKVKVRQYFYSQTEFLRDKFSFHGTGLEMLKGFFRFLLIITPLIGLKILFEYDVANPGAMFMGWLVEFIMFWVLLPLVLVGSLRYRLSRTSWHGLRFSFRGESVEAIKLYLKAGILVPLTFGFYYIYFRTNWQRYLRRNVYFGNKHGEYSGSGGDLVKPFYKKLIFFYFCLFLIFIISGLLFAALNPVGGETAMWVVGAVMSLALMLLGLWFTASLKGLFFNYDWDNTSFEDMKFSSTADTMEIFKLYITNFFIFFLTLGLGTPWITVRNYLFRSYHIRVDGTLDVESIKQDFLDSGASGDIGADFFEIDAGAF